MQKTAAIFFSFTCIRYCPQGDKKGLISASLVFIHLNNK